MKRPLSYRAFSGPTFGRPTLGRPPLGRPTRGSALLAVLMVALILLMLTLVLLPSAQTEEAAGRNTMVQEQLRMGALSIPTIQSVRLTTNNDYRGADMVFDSTPPKPESADHVDQLALRDTLEMEAADLVSDLPCNLCGINNDDIYGNNSPGRNIIYNLEACARRTAAERTTELGRYCLSMELNLLPWKHDGAAQAASEDQVEF